MADICKLKLLGLFKTASAKTPIWFIAVSRTVLGNNTLPNLIISSPNSEGIVVHLLVLDDI